MRLVWKLCFSILGSYTSLSFCTLEFSSTKITKMDTWLVNNSYSPYAMPTTFLIKTIVVYWYCTLAQTTCTTCRIKGEKNCMRIFKFNTIHNNEDKGFFWFVIHPNNNHLYGSQFLQISLLNKPSIGMCWNKT